MSTRKLGETGKMMAVGGGVLVITATIFMAIGIGYVFGAGWGWLVAGAFLLLWGKNVLKGVKNGEYDEGSDE